MLKTEKMKLLKILKIELLKVEMYFWIPPPGFSRRTLRHYFSRAPRMRW
jgi:hypothetical protein